MRTNINFVSTLRCILYKCFWNSSTVFSACYRMSDLIWVNFWLNHITWFTSNWGLTSYYRHSSEKRNKFLTVCGKMIICILSCTDLERQENKNGNPENREKKKSSCMVFWRSAFHLRYLQISSFKNIFTLIHLKCQSFQLNLNREFRMYYFWFWLNMKFRFSC